MEVGTYVLFKVPYPVVNLQSYRIGKVLEHVYEDGLGRPHKSKYVHNLHNEDYWTSFYEEFTNATCYLMSTQIIPAPDDLVSDALLYSLSGDEYLISTVLGEKIIKEYNAKRRSALVPGTTLSSYK